MAATQTEPIPQSSAEFRAYDPDRHEAVQQRHELLAEYLRLRKFDALLLCRPSNIAWLTCGSEVQRRGCCDPAAAVLVTPEARVVLTNNVDSPLLFDGPLSGLGFQLKERPWHEPREMLWDDVCRGRCVATDLPGRGVETVEADLSGFRQRLGPTEEVHLRDLGRDLAHAVQATCRHCDEGATESQIAGHLLHRLAHHLITPVRVQVISDGRGERYRHWGYGDAPVRRFATVSVVGRRQGMHLGVSRTFSFGEPPQRLLDTFHLCGLLLGTGLYFSQAGWAAGDVWSRIQRIYEKFGVGEEWRLADQGEVLGYEPCEFVMGPDAKQKMASGQPVFWHPSVGPAAAGDSILIQDQGQTLLTASSQWPVLTVAIKGTPINLPGLLQREPTDEWAVGG